LRNDVLKKEVRGFFINPKSSIPAASTRSSMFFQAIADFRNSRRKDLGEDRGDGREDRKGQKRTMQDIIVVE
jgi:hypothetical protein